MPTPVARRETADERELAELEGQLVMEREEAERAEADLAEAQSRSRQKRAEIEAATEQLRSLAEALDPSDSRREVFEQFMGERQLRQHATSEIQAHSGLLHDAQAKLEAARQHLEDLPVEAEEPKEALEAAEQERATLLKMKELKSTPAAPEEPTSAMQSELDAAKEERDALLMLKQEKEERERAEAELALARARSAEKKAQLAAAKARLAELQRTPTAQFSPAAPEEPTSAMQSELDAAREERDALLMLKQEKEERERAEAELALARARSAEKKAQLAAAKARLAELQRTPTAQFSPAAPEEPTSAMQSELDAAREERDALLMLKREKEERERAEAELALARARSAEKKAQLAAAKARLAELQRTPTAQFSPAAPEEPTSAMQSELDAAKEERDALLMLKQEKEERERAEAELALARTRSAEKKAQLAAAKARLAELQRTPTAQFIPAVRGQAASTTPPRSTVHTVLQEARDERDALLMLKQEKEERERAEAELALARARSAEKKAQLAAAKARLAELQRTPTAQFVSAAQEAAVIQSEIDAAKEERDALLMLKQEKEERERAEAELALARARSAEKKAQLAAAKARLAELQRTPTAQFSPAAPEEPTSAMQSELDAAREERDALLMLKQEKEERERAEAELALARARSAEKKAQLAAAKARLAELQRTPTAQFSPAAPEEPTSAMQSELDAAKEERDALLMLKREKEERERAEAELALARTRSAEKKAQLAAAKARLAELQRTPTAQFSPAAPEEPTSAMQSELDAAKEERDALLMLKREKEERERAEAELALARARSAEKKAQLAAAKARLAELQRTPTAQFSPAAPEEPTPAMQSELDAAREERDALLMLKQEKEERERAEAELALARTRSAEKKAQLAAAKARLADLEASAAGIPTTPTKVGSASVPGSLPTHSTPSRNGTGMMYEVLKAVAVRDGPDNSAQDFKVGELAPGDVVEALELGTTKDGSMRIRVDCQDGEFPVAGWVNLNTRLGAVLLRPLNSSPSPGRGGSPSPRRGTRSSSPGSSTAHTSGAASSGDRESEDFAQLLGNSAQNLEHLEVSVRERDALLGLKAQRTQHTALDDEEQAALDTLERERHERKHAESELALARIRSAEKKAQLAAATARLSELQGISAASDPSDSLQPLLELKAASLVPSQDPSLQELTMLKQERDDLLKIKSQRQLVDAQLPDPLDAPQTALLRQSTAEHNAELERIRASSKGALSVQQIMKAPTADDLEAEAQLAQYEAELYSEDLMKQVDEEEDEVATASVLSRTASGSLIEEADRLIATSTRQLIELEHERRVGSSQMPPTTARSAAIPSTRTTQPSGGDDFPLMKIARVKMPANTGGSSPPSLQSYGLELSEGLQVLGVRPGSASATVPVGAVLREITGYPVDSLDDIEQALQVLPVKLRGDSLEFVFTYSAQKPKPQPQPRPTPAATGVPEGVPPAGSSTYGAGLVTRQAERQEKPAVTPPATTKEERERDEAELALASAEKKAQLATAEARLAELQRTPTAQFNPAARGQASATAPYEATPATAQSDSPRSTGRARPQPFFDPLAMHKPRPQGTRRRPPARGLLAARKKQGRH